jgi:drug/metabolite transporter (DMT)-like permease
MSGIKFDSADVRWWIPRALAITVLWPLLERIGMSIGGHYSIPQIVGMRYIVQLAVLMIVCLPRAREVVATRRPVAQIIRGLCMFVMPIAFTAAAVSMPRVADGGSPRDAVWGLFWIAPVTIIVISRWWLGERLPLSVWLFVGLAYTGSLLVFGPGLRFDAIATLWALVTSLSFVLYVLLSRRLREESVSTGLFWTSLVVVCAISPLMIDAWRPLQVADIPRVLAIGVGGLLLLMLLDQVLERLPAGFLAPVLYAVVVWQVLGVGLEDRVWPSILDIAGTGLIVAAIAATFVQLRSAAIRHD